MLIEMLCGSKKLVLATPLGVNVLFSCVVALYLCFGALIFQYLEQVEKTEEKLKNITNSSVCVTDVVNSWNKIEFVNEDFIERLKFCLQEPETPPDWSFWSSLLFAFSITSTIGYGHVSPSTVSGRIFFFFYALCGIPLTLVFLANLGKYLTLAAQELAKKLRRKLKKEKDEQISGSTTAVFLTFFPVYWIIGSFLFPIFEPIGIFDGFYFNFVTLTTIGFGDIYPQNEYCMLLSLVYIAIGLALTSNCIDILSDYLKRLHYFGRKLGNLGNISVWFGAKQVTVGGLLAEYAVANNLPPPDENQLQKLVQATIATLEQTDIVADEPKCQPDVEETRPPMIKEPTKDSISIESLCFSILESKILSECEAPPEQKPRRKHTLDPNACLVAIDSKEEKIHRQRKYKHDAAKRYETFQREWQRHKIPGTSRPKASTQTV